MYGNGYFYQMFRTVIPPGESEVKINLSDRILCIGSCFANMVGRKLDEHKFTVKVNPYGIIFNPESIFNLLDFSINHHFPAPHTYIKNQGIFYNYHLHSDFGSPDHRPLKDQIEQAIKSTATWLSEADWLILTFGTAIIYERADNGETVANCHKMPSRLFNKRFLTGEEIRGRFELLINRLKPLNRHLKVMLTVSPVRHIKDGLESNAVSKSILRVASHYLAENFAHVTYFPGYEIMMDDLRDYRFYERDMIHPSSVAEDYIWEMFGQSYFSTDSRTFIREWQKIRKALAHRPFHPQSENHRNFLKKLLMQLHTINDTVDVRAEIEEIERQLNDGN